VIGLSPVRYTKIDSLVFFFPLKQKTRPIMKKQRLFFSSSSSPDNYQGIHVNKYVLRDCKTKTIR
jgi:hypothetical protein